jgi:hypothetical protein
LPGKTISHFLEWLYRDYFPRLEKAHKKAGHKTRLFVVDAFEKAQPRPRLRRCPRPISFARRERASA